jgi:bacteriocin biosynthesis cyclodehydratase domain-containing protein
VRVPERLVMNPRYDVHTVPPDTVFLVNDREQVALQSRFAFETFARCRRPIEMAALRRDLGREFVAVEIVVGVQHFLDRGFLVDATAALADPFWARLGVDRSADLVVSVQEIDRSDAIELRTVLAGLGVDVTDDRTESSLHVVVTNDVLDDRLAVVNEEFLKEGRRWALFSPAGSEPWIGPMFVPGATGCWTCLSMRVWENSPVRSFLRCHESVDDPGFTAPSIPESRAIVANFMGMAVIRWMNSPDEDAGTLVTLDLASLETRRHDLIRVPTCPDCGQRPRREQGRPKLDSGDSVTTDGGLRIVTAEATWKRLRSYVDPILGIVTRLEEKGSQDVLSVFHAQHALFASGHSLSSLRESMVSTTAGKGRTRDQARTSAVCEAIERWSGRFRGYEVDRVASWSELTGGPRPIHPRELTLFSERQYADREGWNGRHSDFAWVPEPFNDDQPIGWTTAWSLTRDEPVLVPTAYGFYNVPMDRGHLFCSADSNGCAAGNTVAEAVLQGFFELVERDAVATWWYNRLPAPAVDLETIADPVLQAVRADYAAHNRELWVLDVTSDLSVATYVAISPRNDHREEIVQGYGAHLDPHIALWRAVSEAHQMLSHLEDVDLNILTDVDLRHWYTEARVEDYPYLTPQGRVPLPRSPIASETTIRAVIDDCVRRCDQAGLEVVVLDQSRDEVPLSVVKVIVPGMRHFWPRFAPGRLYDVPVLTGQLPAPLQEAELNPTPITT